MITHLGDGDDDKAQTLGDGPIRGEVFSTGPRGNLFLGQRASRRQDRMLTANAGVLPASSASYLVDGGGSDGGPGDGGNGGDGGGSDGGGEGE